MYMVELKLLSHQPSLLNLRADLAGTKIRVSNVEPAYVAVRGVPMRVFTAMMKEPQSL